MMPRRIVAHHAHSPLATCRKPLAFNNRGEPVQWCGAPIEPLIGQRCVIERCAHGHVLSTRAVVPESPAWYSGIQREGL